MFKVERTYVVALLSNCDNIPVTILAVSCSCREIRRVVVCSLLSFAN